MAFQVTLPQDWHVAAFPSALNISSVTSVRKRRVAEVPANAPSPTVGRKKPNWSLVPLRTTSSRAEQILECVASYACRCFRYVDFLQTSTVVECALAYLCHCLRQLDARQIRAALECPLSYLRYSRGDADFCQAVTSMRMRILLFLSLRPAVGCLLAGGN